MASIRIEVEDASQTAEVRRVARKLAREAGLDDTRVEQVAIVVTEASTNILKHAGRGEILLGVAAGSGQYLELLALDRGPGMSNVNECIIDGYSTGGTAGQGLGAIRRLSNAYDCYSVPGKGTVLLARWLTGPAPVHHPDQRKALQIGAVNLSKRGEEVCGDSWGVEQNDEFSTLMVADGLGHGYEASVASREAVRMLHQNPDLSPLLLMKRLHDALRSSRGAAVAVARVDHHRQTVAFCGVGNVSAKIHAGSQPGRHLVSLNGTAGHQVQTLREFSYPWPENGILVLYSDGLATGTNLDADPAVALRDPSLIAGVLYRDYVRGQDDATVVVAKAA